MTRIRTLLISSGVAATLLGAPAVVLAAGEFHPGSGEKGYTHKPSHRVLSKDRSEVVSARDDALRSQSQRMRYGESWGASVQAPGSAGPSRAEVQRETLRAMKAGEISKGEL
ncbi:hypothetical protein [Xylophilus sp. ASV27]|uniref:hypothetical protein n=1 Tax=Xylophilus sp. ASV27 TaxID=2795129 RepID=UPI0018ED0508|nr:hypothetical protein [Xylophilus sp. ASV27]